MPRSLAVSRSLASNRVSVQNIPASLSFSGSTIVRLTQTSGLPVYSTSGYSVAGKFKPVNSGANEALYGEANSGSNNQALLLAVSTSKFLAIIKNAAGVQQLNSSSVTKLTLNAWHDFVWIDSNGTVALYIDGVLDGQNFSYTPAAPYTFNTSAIGGLPRASAADLFAGLESGIQLFNYALSPTQVQQVRNGQLTGNVGSYSLTEGAGTTAYDISGNGNNGTITSGTYTSDVPSSARALVGGNLVYNGNFEFAPPTNVATTTNSRWLDGTSGGSTTNGLFGWYDASTGTAAVLFDSANPHTGNYSLKVSTTATGSIGRAMQYNSSISLSNSIPHLFSLSPSTTYNYSYWMKTTANSGAATTGAAAYITSRNISGTINQTFTLNTGVTTTTGWTQYTGTFTTNSTVGYIYGVFDLRVTGNDGTATLIMDAWFANIVLTPTTNTVRQLAT